MKILFVTQRDPFYLPIFFSEFFHLYQENELAVEISGLVLQPSLGNESKFTLLKQVWDLYSPINFCRQAGRFLKHKLNYGLYKLGIKESALAIPAIAKNNGVKILPYQDVNQPEFIDWVKEAEIDLIISASATQIFCPELLAAPKLECINIHSSPLPDYRGMMPNFWQMYHGEDFSVLTIHKMVEELDKGAIIHQTKTPIKPEMTLEELVCQVKRNAAYALEEVLEQYLAGEVEYTPLPDKEGSYFSFPTKKAAQEFKTRGNRLL